MNVQVLQPRTRISINTSLLFGWATSLPRIRLSANTSRRRSGEALAFPRPLTLKFHSPLSKLTFGTHSIHSLQPILSTDNMPNTSRVSSSGIYLCIFSISWKFVPFSWIFFTDPGEILLISLQRMTPSRRMSSYSPFGRGSPKTSEIHWRTSCSCSLFLAWNRFEPSRIIGIALTSGKRAVSSKQSWPLVFLEISSCCSQLFIIPETLLGVDPE